MLRNDLRVLTFGCHRLARRNVTSVFRIKICGITTIDDAVAAAAAVADAIGLNFYRDSPRYVTEETAQAIVRAMPNTILKVALFVNHPAAKIRDLVDRLGLDLVQLHGDEPAEFLAEIPDLPVMRAFRLGPAGLKPICNYLRQCERCGCLPRLVLLDACKTGHYGGTGELADWTTALAYRSECAYPPFVLAGGLNPENVADAISTVRPFAVDASSGVESSPGKKDRKLLAAFVQAAAREFGLA